MEIFVFYNSFFTICTMFGMELYTAHFTSIIVGVLEWLGFFLLQGFGLWKMAERRNLSKKGRAFIPFANILLMGEITGACQFFSQKVKKMGLFTMIAQICATVFSALLLASLTYLYIVEGAPTLTDDYGVLYWGGKGFSKTVEKFYSIGAGNNLFGISVLSILQLVYEIMLLILTMELFKKYAPKNYILLSILGVFVPVSRFIIIFCLRNKTEIDYVEYIRARREAVAREYQQRYGDGYGTPYGGYGSPYGNNPYNQPNAQATQKPEDPFGEFDDKKNADASDSPFEEDDTNKPNNNDEFFN